MNIWLDDIRQVPEGWVHIHNLDELEKLVKKLGKNFKVDVMSFDYHLAHPKRGIDVMTSFSASLSISKFYHFSPKRAIFQRLNTLKVLSR